MTCSTYFPDFKNVSYKALSAEPHISAIMNRLNVEAVNADQCSLLDRINQYAPSAGLT